MEKEVEMEKIKSRECMDEHKVRAEEKIQGQSQVRLVEVVAQMMQQVIQVLHPNLITISFSKLPSQPTLLDV